jgi:hypothetical protein
MTTQAEIPVLAQDRHAKLANMLKTESPLSVKSQYASNFVLNFSQETQADRSFCNLLENRPLLFQAYAKFSGTKGQILAFARHLLNLPQ